MRFYQKIILGIGLVALAAFSLGGALVAMGVFSRFVVVAALSALEQDPVIRLVSLVVFLFLLVMSIYFPFSFNHSYKSLYIILCIATYRR